MNIEKLAEALWAAMESGEASLRLPAVRVFVDEELRRTRMLENSQDFDSRELMEQFFLAFVRDWPTASKLQNLEQYLDALREMRVALNAEEINQHVVIYSDSCRMVDSRENLPAFKTRLIELVLHEWRKSTEPAEQ